MDNDQDEALRALMAIKCKVDDDGCDGPWCSAREQIMEAFGLSFDDLDD